MSTEEEVLLGRLKAGASLDEIETAMINQISAAMDSREQRTVGLVLASLLTMVGIRLMRAARDREHLEEGIAMSSDSIEAIARTLFEWKQGQIREN